MDERVNKKSRTERADDIQAAAESDRVDVTAAAAGSDRVDVTAAAAGSDRVDVTAAAAGSDRVDVTAAAAGSDRVDVSAKFAIDSIVGGRYKVLCELGRGGMAVVYKVEQVFLREQYAFKVLLDEHLKGTSLVRFQHEAQAINRLNHRNLVSFKDFGLLEGNRPFLVIEYIEGTTLESMLKRGGPMAVKDAAEIFLQVCDGLAYAHEHGIIHRDLKPSNIMLPADRSKNAIKILDFGIAKFVCDDDRQALTRSGEVFGSPYYMSPEQCLGRNVDFRSDIYAFGCVLFEAVTGLPPYSGETALATMMQHQSNTIPTLKQASLGGEFPQALEQVVARLLAKEPAHRYQSMMAVKHDLQRILEDQDIHWTAPETKTATRKSASKNGILIPATLGVAVLALSSLAFVGKKSPASTWFEQLSRSSATPDAGKLASTDLSSPVVDTALEASADLVPDQYYADVPIKKAGRGPWVLHFPKESLGTVSLPPGIGLQTDGGKAQGIVRFSVAYPVVLNPSWNACEKPRNFRRFRSNEVYEVNLANIFALDDDCLLAFDHLTGLKNVFVTTTSISDRGLAHISDLPSLEKIRASDTKVTGNGLAKVKRLRHLIELWADSLTGTPAMLRVLDGSTAIRYLSIKNDKLTDADMSYLPRMKNMEKLYLAHNQITDAGLAKLITLKKITDLNVLDTSVTPACIQTLKQFPSLTTLYINSSRWSEKQQKQLRDALPRGCEIKEHYTGGPVEL